VVGAFGGRTSSSPRTNIELTIRKNQFEDFLKVGVFSLLVEEFELRRSPLSLPRSLDVAADLAELPESLMTRIEQQGSRGVMGHQIGVYEDLSLSGGSGS
jgi:hypothetical protein